MHCLEGTLTLKDCIFSLSLSLPLPLIHTPTPVGSTLVAIDTGCLVVDGVTLKGNDQVSQMKFGKYLTAFSLFETESSISCLTVTEVEMTNYPLI